MIQNSMKKKKLHDNPPNDNNMLMLTFIIHKITNTSTNGVHQDSLILFTTSLGRGGESSRARHVAECQTAGRANRILQNPCDRFEWIEATTHKERCGVVGVSRGGKGGTVAHQDIWEKNKKDKLSMVGQRQLRVLLCSVVWRGLGCVVRCNTPPSLFTCGYSTLCGIWKK